MIIRKWIEVEDSCLGPDKKGNEWEMYLIIRICTEFARKKTRNFIRRSKAVKSITGRTKKEVLLQLEKYMAQKNVFLIKD